MFKKIVFAVSVLMIAALLLCGCESYKFKPAFSDYPSADAQVVNNGNLAVQQGDYIYFINSKTNYDYLKSNENYFGNKNNKLEGSIMRATIKNGTIDAQSVNVLVPKDAMTSYTEGGIYVFGDWIYYTSPTTNASFDGTVKGDSTLEFYRTKIDASKTQKLFSVDSTSFQYVVTSEAIFYYLDGDLYYVNTAAKHNFKAKKIAEELTSCYMVKNPNYDPQNKNSVAECVFFTKANDNEGISGNVLYAADGKGNIHKIISENTFGNGVKNVADLYTITIAGYYATQNGVALFYKRTHTNNGSSEVTGTYSYEFADGNYTFNKNNEKVLSYSDLSSVRPTSATELIYVDSSTYTLYKVSCDQNGLPAPKKILAKFDSSVTVSNLVTIKGVDYVLYVESNVLKSYPISEEGNAKVILSSGYATSWLKGVVFNGNILVYDNSSDGDYTYYYDLNTMDDEEPINAILGIFRN